MRPRPAPDHRVSIALATLALVLSLLGARQLSLSAPMETPGMAATVQAAPDQLAAADPIDLSR